MQHIKLPDKACTGYMRREELKSVSMVHKAAVISDCANQGMLHINTDGTMKNQKKLGAVALNGVVVSVIVICKEEQTRGYYGSHATYFRASKFYMHD